MTPHLLKKASSIRLALFDIDGVLSNGQIYLSETGVEYKSFCTQDGLGLKLLGASGIIIGVISGRYSSAVEKRLKELGISFIFQNCSDKLPIYQMLCKQLNLHDAQVAYTGDDLPDLPLVKKAGLGVAVSNAVPCVQEAADWVTKRSGGAGAVREICELIMQSQNTWQDAKARFLVD